MSNINCYSKTIFGCKQVCTCSDKNSSEKVMEIDDKNTFAYLDWQYVDYEQIIEVAWEAMTKNQIDVQKGRTIQSIRLKKRMKKSIDQFDFFPNDNITTKDDEMPVSFAINSIRKSYRYRSKLEDELSTSQEDDENDEN